MLVQTKEPYVLFNHLHAVHCSPAIVRQACLAAALLTLCYLANGQISQVNGAISGVITDPAGSAVPNASVVATSAETGFKRDAQSNDRGEYQPATRRGTGSATVALLSS